MKTVLIEAEIIREHEDGALVVRLNDGFADAKVIVHKDQVHRLFLGLTE